MLGFPSLPPAPALSPTLCILLVLSKQFLNKYRELGNICVLRTTTNLWTILSQRPGEACTQIINVAVEEAPPSNKATCSGPQKPYSWRLRVFTAEERSDIVREPQEMRKT